MARESPPSGVHFEFVESIDVIFFNDIVDFQLFSEIFGSIFRSIQDFQFPIAL